MIVLSQLRLNPRDPRVVRDLGDVRELHRTIMRGFPEAEGSSPRRELGVLFRVDLHGPTRTVVVQSAAVPDWYQLPPGYLAADETKDITSALAGIETDHELRFLLVANASRKSAVRREGEGPRRNSRRVALVDDHDRYRWLAERGERAGFALSGSGPHTGVRITSVIDGYSRSPRSGIVVRPVRFEGRLRVTDAARLADVLRSGIGPAKAYGCGLLSLARG